MLFVLKGPVFSELQRCLPSSLRFSVSASCGGQEGTAAGHEMPTPHPQFTGISGLRWLEGPGILMERESVKAFAGKSLISRAESQPENPEPCR